MISKKKRFEVFKKTNGVCWYCGCDISQVGDMCVEHVTPKSKGGNNDIDNLVPSCRRCNSSKRNRTLEEFREWLSWTRIGVEPFTKSQKSWLSQNGIEIPCPPRHAFWAEKK